MKKTSYIILFIIIGILSGCSPQKRLHRLVSLHPELITNDTIKITDTILFPEITIDTVIHQNTLKDTLTIIKEKLCVKLLQKNDTVYIEAQHEPDTIILTKEIYVH